MNLGGEVNGALMDPHYRFVTGDAADVHRRIQEIDPDLRLAAHSELRDIVVVKWVPLDDLGEDGFTDDNTGLNVDAPGGVWLIAFRCMNPDGTEMIGEPNASVLDQARRASVTNRRREDLEHWARDCYEAHERHVNAVVAEEAEAMAEDISRAVHPWVKQGRLYVPTSIGA